MARWKLSGKHYLNVPGTEWEQREISQQTGRPARKVYPVPAYFDPDDPSHFNYPGEIIVAREGTPHGRDIIFIGPPTPDMEPLDDEAKAISAEQSKKWVHPIESLPGNGYSDQLLAQLTRQLEAVMTKSGPLPQATSVSEGMVGAEDFAKLQAQVAQLMEQNAALMAKLSEPTIVVAPGGSGGGGTPERRAV